MTLEELKVVISAETKGLEKAVNGVKKTVGGLQKTVTSATKKMSSDFNRLGKSINNSFKSLLKSAGLVIGIAGLLKLGKTAIETASDLEEIQNVVEVVFGSNANYIDKWAKRALTSFGLVESEAKDYASQFKAMANGMGIVDKTGLSMSTTLTELSADLASFRNTSAEIAATALKGVFTGETEALKKFGVVMTQANLDAFALSKGITKSYQSMTQAEKVALRYQYVMQATADAQGDFARSSHSWANQMRVLRGQWTNFLGVLGTGIKQVLSPLLKILNNILASVITVTKNMLALFGVDFSTTVASVSSGAAGAEELADGLGDAAGNAKKLNKEIAGFDELETIGKKVDGAGGLADDLASAASDLEIELPEISTDENDSPMFKSFREAIEKLQDWFENKLDPTMTEGGRKFAEKVNEIFGDKTVWELAGSTISSGLNAIIHALDAFWTEVDGIKVGTSLASLFNGWTQKWDAPATGHLIGEKIKTMLDIANSFLETYNFQGLGAKISAALDEVPWRDIGNKLAGLISNMLLAAMDLAVGLSQGNLGTNVSNFIDGWSEGWKGEELKKKFVEEFKPAMQEAWKEIWEGLGTNTVVSDLIQSLKDLTAQITVLVGSLAGLKLFTGIFTFLNTGIPVLTLIADKLFHISTWAEAFPAAANGLVSPLTFLKGLWYQLKVSITAVGESLGVTTATLGTFATVATTIVVVLGTVIAALISAYKNNEKFRQTVNDLAETLKTFFQESVRKVAELYNDHIKPFVDKIMELIKVTWENGIRPFLEGVWTWIRDKVTAMAEFIIPMVKSMVEGAKNIIGNLIDFIGHFIDVLSGITDFLIGIFTGNWERAWEGIKSAFGGAIEAMVDLLKAKGNIIIGFFNVVLSGISSIVNTVIRGLNRMRISVPDWVPGIGGKSWGFNIKEIQGYQIPYLANGGVIENPTVAMLGEYAGARQNPEIAAPESMIRDIIVSANGDMVSAFYQMATQIIQAIDNVDMTVQIGDDTIAQAAKRGSDNYYRRTGKPMYAM